MSKTPATNPPIWANQAVPPASGETLFHICKTTQNKSKMMAGIRTMVQKKPRKIKVFIFAKGNKIKYPPNTPDIAPLAPTMGILESRSVAIWPRAARVPQTK